MDYYKWYYKAFIIVRVQNGVVVGSKTEAILIRRGLSLYKQPLAKGRGSPNWYARVYLPIAGKAIHTKSTGTSDLKDARKFAESFWADCHLLSRTADGTLPLPSGKATNIKMRFDHIGEQWIKLKEQEAGKDKRLLRAVRDIKQSFYAKNGLATFFGRMDVSAITTDKARDYLRFAVEHSNKDVLASSTQKGRLVVLNQILKHAYEKRLLSQVPMMPKVKKVDNPRPWFTLEEYHQLRRGALRLARVAQKENDEAQATRWKELNDFIVFMVNTFLRPSEWPAIKNRHVSIEGEGLTRHLNIAITEGKTRKRYARSMPRAVAVYERIVARNGKESDTFLFKTQYLNRTTAQEKMRDAFEALLNKTGLALDAFENKRTTYSLRHSSLMFRLLYGDNVDLLVLAKNASTSVDQLQRFYLSHLDPGMKLANLQSFKK